MQGQGFVHENNEGNLLESINQKESERENMSETNLFERATREQFRWNSPQGLLSVEDLWDLPLTSEKEGRANLDDIAKELHKKVKAADVDEVSFVKPKKTDTTTPAMFEIVKYIIAIKLAENEAKRMARENAEQKQKIMAAMAAKQNQKLEASSLEELQTMLDNLGKVPGQP